MGYIDCKKPVKMSLLICLLSSVSFLKDVFLDSVRNLAINYLFLPSTIVWWTINISSIVIALKIHNQRRAVKHQNIDNSLFSVSGMKRILRYLKTISYLTYDKSPAWDFIKNAIFSESRKTVSHSKKGGPIAK